MTLSYHSMKRFVYSLLASICMMCAMLRGAPSEGGVARPIWRRRRMTLSAAAKCSRKSGREPSTASATSFSNSTIERRGGRGGRRPRRAEEPPEARRGRAGDLREGDALDLGELRVAVRPTNAGSFGFPRNGAGRGRARRSRRASPRKRQRGGGLSHVLGHLERDHPRIADEVPERDRGPLPRLRRGAEGGKTPRGCSGLPFACASRDREHVRFRLPVVEEDRPAEPLGERELGDQRALLVLPRGEVVESSRGRSRRSRRPGSTRRAVRAPGPRGPRRTPSSRAGGRRRPRRRPRAAPRPRPRAARPRASSPGRGPASPGVARPRDEVPRPGVGRRARRPPGLGAREDHRQVSVGVDELDHAAEDSGPSADPVEPGDRLPRFGRGLRVRDELRVLGAIVPSSTRKSRSIALSQNSRPKRITGTGGIFRV